MNDNLTLIAVILDRSGSMSSIKSDMEGGLNTFIKEQASEPGECRLTLTQFDNEYEVVADYIDIKKAKHYPLVPRGNTALLDAIGKTVTTVGEKLARLPEKDRPGKVVVMVITDGQENASRDWKREQVMDLITQQTNIYNWQFTYLGANQDAIAVGARMGFSAGATMDYAATSAGSHAMYASASNTISNFRGGQSIGINYSDDDRKKAKDS